MAAHLYFPKEYPLRPPRMRFVTEIWHPNIDQNGDGKCCSAHDSHLLSHLLILIMPNNCLQSA